jgi:hypothetical protein
VNARTVVITGAVLFVGCLAAIMIGNATIRSWAGIIGAGLIAAAIAGLAASKDRERARH